MTFIGVGRCFRIQKLETGGEVGDDYFAKSAEKVLRTTMKTSSCSTSLRALTSDCNVTIPGPSMAVANAVGSSPLVGMISYPPKAEST